MKPGIEANVPSLMRSPIAPQRQEEDEGRNAGCSALAPLGGTQCALVPYGKRKGSLGYQMETALKKIFHPGHRRHDDKKYHREDVIRGISTMRRMVGEAYQFARYVRKSWPEVHELGQLVPAMAQSYLADFDARGRTEGRVTCARTRLRKLDQACRKTGVFAKDAPALVPLGSRGRKRAAQGLPRRRAYTEEEARRIIEAVSAKSPQAGRVLELMRTAGLRVSEAVYLHGTDVDPEHLTITLQGAVNHAKGGRPRVIHLPPEQRDFLVDLQELGLESPDAHLFDSRLGLAERVRTRVRVACQSLGIKPEGTHGFRRTFANHEFQRERSAGTAAREAMRRVSQQLGHNRVGVIRTSYLDPSFLAPRGEGKPKKP